MKTNQKTFFIIGLVLIIISLIGLGSGLKEFLTILIGIFIIILSYFLPGARGFLGNRQSNAFIENTKKDIPSVDVNENKTQI